MRCCLWGEGRATEVMESSEVLASTRRAGRRRASGVLVRGYSVAGPQERGPGPNAEILGGASFFSAAMVRWRCDRPIFFCPSLSRRFFSHIFLVVLPGGRKIPFFLVVV